jgi:heptosyltransferase-3
MHDNVLIYRLGSIGDTVLALPAFRLVRRVYPDAKLTLLTNFPVNEKAAPVESVLENTGLVDEVIKYPLRLRKWNEFVPLWKTLSRRRFDKLIYLTQPRGYWKSVRDYLFFLSCGIRGIIGVPFAKDDLSSHPIPGTDLYRWEAERLVRCLRELGMVDLNKDEWWDLGLTAQEQAEAESLLSRNAITLPFVAASIGAKVDTKDWTDANWGKLLGRLTSLYPALGLVLLGSLDEQHRTDRLLGAWEGPKANLCGLASPRVSAAVIQRAKVFVGHDSGPMHLAGAVVTPTVAIFSARNLPGEWYPRGNHHTIMYRKTFCFGCERAVCERYGKRCILSITVDEVLNAVREYL